MPQRTRRSLELFAWHFLGAGFLSAPFRISYPHARSGRAALRALTALVALVHCLEDGTLRLRLCYKNQALLEALRQDVAAAFTALAGIVAGHASGSLKAFLIRHLVANIAIALALPLWYSLQSMHWLRLADLTCLTTRCLLSRRYACKASY